MTHNRKSLVTPRIPTPPDLISPPDFPIHTETKFLDSSSMIDMNSLKRWTLFYRQFPQLLQVFKH